MCGIAGRIRYDGGAVGADIVKLAMRMRHRGPDSTGFAIYGQPRESGYVVRAFLDDRDRLDATLQQAEACLKAGGASLTADPTWDEAGQPYVQFRMEISEVADLPAWVDRVEKLPGLELLSVGRSLEVVKDVGDADAVDAKHGVSRMNGTHALVNARMATESLVSPVASHPFWARPFPDVCIVHNGQLTNYFKWRRQLEREGYSFSSENDSELIAVWNSVQMDRGLSLHEALKLSQSELDGVFTYLLGTADGISMAKDRWAIKPVAVVSEADGIAVATEEQALRGLYHDEVHVTNFDEPLMTEVWGLTAKLKEAA